MEHLTSLDYTEEDLKDDSIPESTPMKDYFRDKIVFLTGGTGFLGKLFVEKLLRSNVKCLYLLIRPKKGSSPKERLEEIFSGILFSKLRSMDSKYLKRVKLIHGDMEKLHLDISNEDLQDMQHNVQIVIHAAADVRFDQTLTKLIRINVRGTRELLKIAENMKKLEVFAYISTAYSNCPRKKIDEEFYPPNVDPAIMIEFIDKFENDPSNCIDVLQNRITIPWPNNYCFSKSLSEEVVRNYGKIFPICVIRPTVVISTHEDPIPAWCDNIYGLNGLLIAAGAGIMRIMPYNARMKADIVCADFVINSTLAAVWTTYEEEHPKSNNSNEIEPQKDPGIYHISNNPDRPLTNGEIHDTMYRVGAKYPSKKMLWKPCSNNTNCPFMLKLLILYYHVIPAYFIDLYLAITKKPIRIMPVYRKLQKFLTALTHFTTNEWEFSNDNMRRVLSRMCKEDKEFFPSDVRRFNWTEYSYIYGRGLKLYIGSESMDNITEARKKYRKLVIAHYLVLSLYYCLHILFFYFVLKFFGFFDYIIKSANDTYRFIQNPI